jgi:hypothetical protein
MPENTEFLPFHAINEFMRPDFRLSVIRDTLTSQAKLPEDLSKSLDEKIRKNITVPGFRTSDKAPALIKVLPTSKAFEKYPDLVAVILSCWAELHSELQKQVYQLFKSRNWKMFQDTDGIIKETLTIEAIKEWPIFPITFNRTKLPGFFTHWPKGEEFEVLYSTFTELFPDVEASIDKVSLMVVWLSMRLPTHIDDLPTIPEE